MEVTRKARREMREQAGHGGRVPPVIPIDGRDEYLTAVGIGRVVAFMFYSFLPALLTVWTFRQAVGAFSEPAALVSALSLLLTLEIPLGWLVFNGLLPGTSGAYAFPFSETELAMGVLVLLLLPVGLLLGPIGLTIYRVAIGVLLLAVIWLYFALKTVISRQVCWEALAVTMLPTLMLIMQAVRHSHP
ncbi:MAG: hypothetical protein OEY97_09385 [Nitrospirota bacterium]|nr:hypothetical protein [Nitrospirota bacterium]